MIFLLLPAYNEEKSLNKLIPDLYKYLKDYDYQIVVCNDGSTDKTEEILKKLAKKYNIHVIKHKINRGLGETSRDLFEYAAEHSKPGDIIIRMDCDNTHKPKYIPKLLKKLKKGYDVVITSRFQKGGGQKGISAYRAFISYMANIFMRTLFRVPNVKEYSCGYRAYKAEIIKKAIDFYGNDFIQLKGLGFTCTLEKILKLHLIGAKFSEIPFVLRYDEKKSSSKMISSITTLGYFIMLINYYWPWGGWKNQTEKKLKNLNDF